MTQQKKLSAGMQRVIDIMNSASGYWEAICTQGMCFLQEGKIGYGGQSEKLRADTFFALYQRGVFVRAKSSTKYETHYTLAPAYRRKTA